MTSKVFSWCLYDLSNTAFSALFVTFFFPFYIKEFLHGNEFQIGLVFSISMIIAAFLVPFLGALSDATGKRMPFIIIFTLACVIFTMLIPYLGLYFALLLGLLANLTYHAALDIYDALLPAVAGKNINKVSGYGTAIGYIGTILSLVMAYVILKNLGWESQKGVEAVFLGTGIFFFLFSLPTFINIKDKQGKEKLSFAVKKAFASLKETFTNWRKYKALFLFLISSFLFMDGANTAIIFLYLYGRDTLGITVQQFFPLYAAMAVTAAIGALLSGKISDLIGAKKTLSITIIAWLFIIGLLLFKRTYWAFALAGLIGGVALASLWTATRPMLLLLAPKHKIAELMGFQGLTEKLGGFVGPALFGYFVTKSASYVPGLVILLLFFILAFIVLLFVKVEKINFSEKN